MNPRQRKGAIYMAIVRHPVWRVRCVGYVGKTRQWPARRWAQHEATQPWAHRIVEWRIVKEWRDISAIALWWAEVWRIVLRLPLYNIQWNRHNPRRIKPWKAR